MEECRGLGGAVRASAMAALILAFLAFLVAFSRLLWLRFLKGLGVPEYSPLPLAAVGAAVAVTGLAGLAWVYSTFPPHVMLCRTISDLPETLRAAVALLLRAPEGRLGGSCKGGSEAIVAVGPYACVRHPLYSSVTLVLLGASLAAPWLAPSLLVAVPAYYVLSLAEERVLDSRTCGAYSKAMAGRPLLNPLRLALCVAGLLLGRRPAGGPQGGR